MGGAGRDWADLRGAIGGGAGVVRGGRLGFVAETGAGGFGEIGCFMVLVLGGLGERGFGGVPVFAGESDFGETTGFDFNDVPVVCGERRLGVAGDGRDNPDAPSENFVAGD